MGRGGAQLGKAIKGKAKERRKERGGVGGAAGGGGEGRRAGGVRQLDVNGVEVEDASAGELSADVRALEEYERMAAAAEWHRRRLQEMARSERSVQGLASSSLHWLYRQWKRQEKSSDMRWELDVLTHSHTAEVRRKEQLIHNALSSHKQHQQQSHARTRTHAHCRA